MNKICTTVKQSKKLMELGIDVNTADMYYPNRIGMDNYPLSIEWKNGLSLLSQEIPAWSLAALLGLMPKNESLTIDLCLGGSNGIEHTFDWFCTCDENGEPYDYKTFQSKSPIDCTFEMICWLLENKKL